MTKSELAGRAHLEAERRRLDALACLLENASRAFRDALDGCPERHKVFLRAIANDITDLATDFRSDTIAIVEEDLRQLDAQDEAAEMVLERRDYFARAV